MTVDSRTGDTATEHMTVLASGSHQVNGFGGYTAMSRERLHSWLILSDGEERREILPGEFAYWR